MSTDDALPAPPWSPRRRRPGPAAKAPLTRDAIVAAALEILDAEGLEGISMRRVAERLGTGPASLYQHVANKDDLLEQLLDHVIGEIELPAPDPRDWQTPIKQLLRATRATLSAHRDVAYVTLGRIPTGGNALRVAERMLAIMRAGGVPDQVCAYAVDTLMLFVGAVSYEESIQSASLGATEAEARAYVRQVHDYFAALPPDRFPSLVALAGHLTRWEEGEDARFEFGLTVQVGGVAALAAAAREGTPGSSGDEPGGRGS